MTDYDDPLTRLDAVLDKLVLNTEDLGSLDEKSKLYLDFGYRRAGVVLRTDDDDRARRTLETRLRLAMHLAPASAIAYDRSNPVPRWRLIRDYIVENFKYDQEAVESLAREVAGVLDDWDTPRRQVSSHRVYLIRRDGASCAHCHLKDGLSSMCIRNRDEYKPYYISPEELTTLEVDHIQSVSGVGTNELHNLQLLCRLCNAGKGDGLGVSVRAEAAYAGSAIEDVPIAHRIRMTYYVIARDRRACTKCGSRGRELTVRLIFRDGAYIRSNLQSVCVSCAYRS